jgi:hypothetical protein
MRATALAGPILDLYQRVWEGAPLGADNYVICADEKTSIQARPPKTTDAAAGAQSPHARRA